MNDQQQTEYGAAHGTFRSYITGFALSLFFTLTAFGLVYVHILSVHTSLTHSFLYEMLVSLAIMQLFVQLIFFLHVGKESKSHWNLTALAFALIVVLILVGGTLWIMFNLQHGNTEPFENGVVTPQTEG